MHKQKLLKAHNRAAILNVVRQHGPISRVDVARLSGLSVGAVTGLTRELVDNGLVYEKQEGDSRGGRPPILLALQPDGPYVVGLKLAENTLTFALTNLNADVIARATLTGSMRDPEKVAARVAEGIGLMLAETGIHPGKLLGVGVGMAGILDAEAGVCRMSPYLGWENVPLAALVEKWTNLPVYLDNDVNTLTLVEKLYGAGLGVNHFLTVTVGRGVGLGIVVNGQLYRGGGGAGEFGHSAIDRSGDLCDCGKRGCLETFVGDPWLLRHAAARGLSVEGVEQLADAVRQQQPVALQLLREAGDALGRAVAMLVNVFDPELLIFSGEGIRYGDALLAPMRAALRINTMPALLDGLRLHVEPLGDDAWARGAASLVLQELFRTSQPDLNNVGSS